MRYLGEQESESYSGSVHCSNSFSCLAIPVKFSCFRSTCYDFGQVHLPDFKIAGLNDCINAKSFYFVNPK